MRVTGLDHVNIRTPDVEETCRFFVNVLGMKVLPSPVSDNLKDAAWVADATGHAVVHLISSHFRPSPDGDPPTGGGRVDHFALSCKGYDDAIARLRELGAPCRADGRVRNGVRQIFTADPNGVAIELNFSGD